MPVITILAGQFQKPAATFLEEFSAGLRNGTPFPIIRVFSLFPINPVYEQTVQSFANRGSIQVSISSSAEGSISGRLSNSGSNIDALFRDEAGQNIGDVSVYCPEVMEASFVLDPASARVEMVPGNEDDQPRVTLYKPSLKGFVFRGVLFERDRFTYTLSEDGNKQNTVVIVTDFTRSPTHGESPAGLSIDPGMKFQALTLLMGGGESGCGGEKGCPGLPPSEPTGDPNKYYVCRYSDGKCNVRKGGCGYGYVTEVAKFDTEKDAQDFILKGGCK